MTSKWAETGILRKKQTRENFDDLLVFGYACKLFRDDERALYIDQGKHLIPWMGCDRLKIDRYDGRGTLSDLSSCEASSEGYDATRWLGLHESDRKLEQLCDEERYYYLHKYEEDEVASTEEEEKLRKNNEFKYNYNVAANPDDQHSVHTCDEQNKIFVPAKSLDVPVDIVIPKTVKENARIEKTALFISQQGPQMEILIKAKQSNNPQFSFMNQNDPLQKYYRYLVNAIKSGQYKPKEMTFEDDDVDDESTLDPNSVNDSEHYLHPALASAASVLVKPTVIAVPQPAPALQYKPAADCAYTQLVSRIKGNVEKNQLVVPEAPLRAQPSSQQQEHEISEQYYPYYQTQYYQYYQQIAQQYATQGNCDIHLILQDRHLKDQIQQQAVHYAKAACAHFTVSQLTTPKIIDSEPTVEQTVVTPTEPRVEQKVSLVHYSSDSDDQELEVGNAPDEKSTFIMPPKDVVLIVDKMATYVSKNGLFFEQSVKEKGDPRFEFLNESHKYHKYYRYKVNEFSAEPKETQLLAKPANVPQVEKDDRKGNKSETPSELKDKTKEKKAIAAVCFSIKKSKEDPPKDMKSALPVEESDEENGTREFPVYVATAPATTQPTQYETVSITLVDNDAQSEETPASRNDTVFNDDPILEMIDLTSEPLAEKTDVKLLTDQMSKDKIAARERALQQERKKRAALFLKMQLERKSGENPRMSRAEHTTSSLSDSDLEEGEIRQKSKRNKKYKSSSKSSKTTKHSSDYYEPKSKHRKLKKRKYASSSSSDSE